MSAISRSIPFFIAIAAMAQPYLNLDFEVALGARPRIWGIPTTPHEYALDSQTTHSGAQSLRIRSLTTPATTLGVASQLFPIDLVRGKRVRVSGWIKTESVNGYAAIWWRVDGPSGFITLDNMSAAQR
ncbi:MAG: hypothetical protein ACRD8O_18630 [Bryobacteraceae bacterium]